MKRRQFLLGAAALGLGPIRSAAPVIDRIRIAPFEGRFHKFVAMNAYDQRPKGHTYSNTLIRIHTTAGVEGIGVATGNPDAQYAASLKPLIGANPMSLYEMHDGRIAGRGPQHAALLSRYRHLDCPLFDLIGKMTRRPMWQLIGASARERVEVYDGTLYFSDIWFSDRGVRAVVEEAEEAVKSGFRGMKLKVGRGFKWMNPEDGLRRDIAVIKAVRKAVGPDIKVMADANNGYRSDHERAWRLLAETADANLYWMEEIFPENVADYTALREKMRRAGIKTLIADGESVHDIAEFDQYLKPKRTVDVLQMDIRAGGFLDNRTLAGRAEAAGAVVMPHNWASQIGLLMGLQLAKAVSAVPGAESERSTADVLIPEGYEFRDGSYSVPDKPGLSVRIDEKIYDQKCKPAEINIAS